MKKKFNKGINEFILFISCIVFALALYVGIYFKYSTFEQLYYAVYASKGASIYGMIEGFLFVSLITILFYSCIKLIQFLFKKSKRFCLIFSFSDKSITIFIIIFFVISLFTVLYKLKFFEYIHNQNTFSNIFENYYVNPKETKIEFPKEKQNLIYIFVESLETTTLSKKNGGIQNTSYIPNLEKLALKNTNFSNSSKLGGALQSVGTNWTVAAMIAQTSGLPLKISMDGNINDNYSEFLPGAYSLGEILKDNGYKNYIMMGSNAYFGSRKEYFDYHGNYEIYDYLYAKENNLIPEDYFEWWGYEDSKLYSFAKDKLLEISQNDEPFNFTMLTADTHFQNGYIDASCETTFENHYENSYFCTDKMLSEFISWIQKQDFYQNTTIIITGDHQTMQESFYTDIDEHYKRTILNIIINSKSKTSNTKNRLFNSFDFYPTTLASLGCTIEGNKLGLGTNLYSKEKTLIEELSFNYVDVELARKSEYYDTYILGNKYIEK